MSEQVKPKQHRITIPKYTLGEELTNSISHGVGAGLGIAALVLCIVKSAIAHDGYKLASSIVFGITVTLLYLMSCLYHALKVNKAKRVFRVMDHCTIFLLIAGTYTPYCLIPLYGTAVGWTVLIAQWACAIGGITMNAIALNNKVVKGLSMGLYVITGWMALAFVGPLYPVVSGACFWLLLGGGIAYTVGIAFFAFGKKVRYFHAVWHLFVLLGTVLQFTSILLMM